MTAVRYAVFLLTLCAAAWRPLPANCDDAPQQPGAASVSDEQVREAIRKLGDDDYFVRERAQAELSQLGFAAFDALCEAKLDPDPEIAARASYLARRMHVGWSMDSDPPDARSLMNGYDSAGDSVRLAIVRQLSRLPESDGVAILCRLVRYERSPVLAKNAALEIIAHRWVAESEAPARLAAVEAAVANCRRPAAEWLRAYVATHRDPASAGGIWSRLAEQESLLLDNSPDETQPSLVAGLWRQHAELSHRAAAPAEVHDAIRRVIALESGAGEGLARLVGWLVELRAYDALDEVEQEFADSFESDSVLMYCLAEAREAQGRTDEAARLAQRAADVRPTDAAYHSMVYFDLVRYGMTKSIERELTAQVESADVDVSWAARCNRTLAEALHDRGDEAGAARAIDRYIKFLDEQATENRNFNRFAGGDIDEARARYHYFMARAHELAGDSKARLESLQAGLGADPKDIEILIALYRTADLPADQRERTVRLIGEAAEELRQSISNSPELPLNYNQLAWLVGNTEGDFKQAIENSRKSIELTLVVGEVSLPELELPNRWLNVAGYTDTLARCHYAAGDFAAAVKLQTRATQLEPNSGQMRRQLALFQETLAKSPGK